MERSQYEIRLPRLIGSRTSARALLASCGDLEGATVVLYARDLRSASPSSIDEFVKAVLVEGHAATLAATGAGEDFLEDLQASALARGVNDRIAVLAPS